MPPERTHDCYAVVSLPATTQSSPMLLTGPHKKASRGPIRVWANSINRNDSQRLEDRDQSETPHNISREHLM